jgi:hypothetical protein
MNCELRKDEISKQSTQERNGKEEDNEDEGDE